MDVVACTPQPEYGSVMLGHGAHVRKVDLATCRARTLDRWQLWHVGWDGSHTVLDVPPPGYADDSPRVQHRAVVFVRSRNGSGTLYALGLGPLPAVGHDDGFFGHRPWTSASWSLQR